jgi:hypothetical protein
MIVKFTLLGIRPSTVEMIVDLVTLLVTAIGGQIIIETEPITQEIPHERPNAISTSLN